MESSTGRSPSGGRGETGKFELVLESLKGYPLRLVRVGSFAISMLPGVQEAAREAERQGKFLGWILRAGEGGLLGRSQSRFENILEKCKELKLFEYYGRFTVHKYRGSSSTSTGVQVRFNMVRSHCLYIFQLNNV